MTAPAEPRANRGPRPATLALAALVVILAAVAIWSSRSPLPLVRLADGVEVRCLNPSAWPTAELEGDGFPLTVAGHEVPEIELVSRHPLAFVIMEFERRAAASIELEGGRVTERILHPDGRVQFRVALDPATGRRGWWPFGARYRYRLEWVMPEAPGGPLGVTLFTEPEVES